MKTVILGCGYVGLALMQFWSKNTQFSTTGTTTSPEKCHELQNQGFDIQIVHSSQLEKLEQLISCADTLIVCIGNPRGGSYNETYLNTAHNIYKSITNNSSLKHIIYLSSTSVYGNQEGSEVDENSTLNPNDVNSNTLVQTEHVYLRDIAKLVKVSVLRLGGIYGPGRTYEQRLEYLRLKQPIKGANMLINAVHQEDIIRAIDWVLMHKLSGVYNVCADAHPTRAELYNQYAEQMNLPPIEWDLVEKMSPSNKKVSASKIQATGFTFNHSCNSPEK